MSTTRFTAAAMAALLAAPFALAQNAAEPTGIKAAAADQAPENLPAAKDVIARAIDAMGGTERLEAIESTAATLELSTPMGSVGMNMKWHRDGKMHIVQVLPNGMGEITMGYDGHVGWIHNPLGNGYELMPEKQIDDMRGQANIFMVVTSLEKEFKTIETIAVEEFRTKPCYKLRMVDEDGTEGFAYFDEKSALIAGIESVEQGPVGAFTVKLGFADWKEAEGVNFFRKLVINQNNLDMEMVVTELELNKVPADAFDLPAEVKELASAKPVTLPEADGNAGPAKNGGGG